MGLKEALKDHYLKQMYGLSSRSKGVGEDRSREENFGKLLKATVGGRRAGAGRRAIGGRVGDWRNQGLAQGKY